MTDLAPNAETVVGIPRHAVEHLVRHVSAEDRTYILHSQACLDATLDLRDCPFSLALDKNMTSIAMKAMWDLVADQPVVALVRSDGRLYPNDEDLRAGAKRHRAAREARFQ